MSIKGVFQLTDAKIKNDSKFTMGYCGYTGVELVYFDFFPVKAEEPVISYDDVVNQVDVHIFAGKSDTGGQFDICFTWHGIPGRVVVQENDLCGIM